MTHETLARQLVDVTVDLSVLPASYRADLRRMLREQMDQKDPALLAEQCMEYLTLAIKYMNFDLEATRRENEYLRSMLENQSEM
ncbi:MAG: hypothetical protein PHU85_00915 [Phycisphaerae bacterium]|nr:hypothetical protein [Phycisphaerae bacterium]